MGTVVSEFFFSNLKRRLWDASIFIGHYRAPGISNRAKSAYLRAAMILASTIVEGLVYYFIVKTSSDKNPLISSELKISYSHKIPDPLAPGANLVIGKQSSLDVRLRDRTCTFKNMNRYCRDKNLITSDFYEKLERVREMRNALHVQALSSKDTGYTMQNYKFIDTVMGDLIDHISSAPFDKLG